MPVLRPANEGVKESISKALRRKSVNILGLYAEEGAKLSISKALRQKSVNT